MQARVALPFLLLLSGFCGISYEILYTKLLGNLLGNQFIINATVLLTFLLGIGLGTLCAHRFLRFLWAIEAGIGVYAALMAVFQAPIDRFVFAQIPFLGTNIAASALVAFVLLALPAFLVGCSVPLFASYLGTLRTRRVFATTYAIYNIGAAVTALAMEFLLLRSLGLRAATLLLASLNGAVALGLLALMRSTPLIPTRLPERIRFPRRMLLALALASVASAVFQLLMIKLGEFVFGPYNETFSLVLVTVFLGLAAGSALAGIVGLTFSGALLLCLAGLALVLGALPAAAAVYASLYPSAAPSYWLLVLLKLGFVFALMGLPAIGFGATIPSLLRTHRDVARESGQLLFCSSMANALGFLLMAFVLHTHLDYGPILLVIAGLTGLALLAQPRLRRASAAAAFALVALAALAHRGAWDEALLYVGHTNFHSAKELREERATRSFDHRFKGPQDVFAIVSRHGEPYFFINGYISIPLRSVAEKIVGIVPSMLSPRLDEALVLGMGSGATAGTVSLIFDRTDVVEINQVVLDNLHRMAEYNFDIEYRPGVTIIHDDGIHHIKTTPRRYSLILNTVTTPLYFSSSKLYTRDFFELVSRRLTPDGVYATWVDARIGDRGTDIIMESLRGVFAECWLAFVRGGYYQLICSNDEIRPRQVDAVTANGELDRYLARGFQLPIRSLAYSVISTDAFDLQSPTPAPVNTLDFPVLEFEMARLVDGKLRGFHDRMKDRLDLRPVERVMGNAMEWSPAELLFHADFRTQQILHAALPGVLRSVVASEYGDVDADYDRAGLAVAAELGSPAAYRRTGRTFLNHQRYDAAIAAFSRALELRPTIENVHFSLGEAHLERGDYELALRHLETQWAIDRNKRIPLRAGRALIGLQRYYEALDWLEKPGAFRKPGKRVHYLRGVAYEGMGDLPRARQHYEAALAMDSDDALASAALERLGDLPAH
jgi:predicted membrane-bound spermidine synthase/Flp pilus assembly protein TadD